MSSGLIPLAQMKYAAKQAVASCPTSPRVLNVAAELLKRKGYQLGSSGTLSKLYEEIRKVKQGGFGDY